MFAKHTYSEITVVHLVNFRNKLTLLVLRSEVVVRIDFVGKQYKKLIRR